MTCVISTKLTNSEKHFLCLTAELHLPQVKQVQVRLPNVYLKVQFLPNYTSTARQQRKTHSGFLNPECWCHKRYCAVGFLQRHLWQCPEAPAHQDSTRIKRKKKKQLEEGGP